MQKLLTTIPNRLLEGMIDYAGLFPPAQLPLFQVVQNYSGYLQSANRNLLGRLIVPCDQLPELEALLERSDFESSPISCWPVSVTLPIPSRSTGSELRAALNQIKRHNLVTSEAIKNSQRGKPAAFVDSIEYFPQAPAAITEHAAEIPEELYVYCEVPIADLERYLPPIEATSRFRAKLRMGGTTVDKFPAPKQVVSALERLIGTNRMFKATAGLHHPVRGNYPLTYACDSPKGTMHGFINLLLATAAIRLQMSPDIATWILEDSDPANFRPTASGFQWRDLVLDWSSLRRTREESFVAFGSCSFTEPLEDLTRLGWLG